MIVYICAGVPVFIIFGLLFEGHRRLALLFHAAALQHGIRLICVERHGTGLSNFEAIKQTAQSKTFRQLQELQTWAMIDGIKLLLVKLHITSTIGLIGHCTGAATAVSMCTHSDMAALLQVTLRILS
jgi:dienelactone hydrolase